NTTAKNALFEIAGIVEENFDVHLHLDKLDDVLKTLRSKDTKNDKYNKLKTLFNVEKGDKIIPALIGAICGKTVNVKDIYNDYDGEPNKICFDTTNFDEEVMPSLESALGSDAMELIFRLKAVYDWMVLDKILDNEKYISAARVKSYEKHKEDLKRLRDWIRKNKDDKWYKLTFRIQKENDNGKSEEETEEKSETEDNKKAKPKKLNNYARYIGMDKHKHYESCSKQDFYKFLKSDLKIDDKQILAEIEDGSFLPKQMSAENCIIPYQAHLMELEEILKSEAKRFPFLNNVSDSMTIAEKIIKLMTFRIPYYVGPLKTYSDGDKFNWVVKKEGEEKTKVTPWNIDSVVDKDASEKEFIRRMTRKCTYIKGEDVLPENSLVYKEYVFLNELNNLRINGEKNLKAKTIIYEKAKTVKKVTLKLCLKWLKEAGEIEKDATVENVFSGLNGDFENSLGVYNTFKGILNNLVETHSEMCEDIIFLITVISDKSRLEKKLKELNLKNGNVLSDEMIKSLKGLNYSKWGKFSKKLLTEIEGVNPESGEVVNLIEALRTTTNNFMEAYYKFGFAKKVDEINGEILSDGKITYQSVDNLYCSPSVKRAIWRSVCLVNEIVKIEGRPPKKLFIEMARDKADNGKKGLVEKSRKDKILEKANLIFSNKEIIDEIKNTPEKSFSRGRRGDVLYLYYMQGGKCAYTGERIDLQNALEGNELFDRDHIYPQSKIRKDDSLDNLVLVKKTQNVDVKKDIYPIPASIRDKMRPTWDVWVRNGQISQEKYYRLTRTKPLTADEKAAFIDRQLVETRQSTKEVAALMKELLPETEVVYVKGGNVSDFRQEKKLVKVRELNDLHHAADAYLNVVVGNVFNVKFGHNSINYFKNKESSGEPDDVKDIFGKDIYGAWKVCDTNRIINTARKNSARVVRFTHEESGQMFNLQIVAAGKNDKLIPLKKSGPMADTKKYGGYDGKKVAHFMLVRSDNKKGKKRLTLEAMTVYEDRSIGKDVDKKIAYLKRLGLVNPEILIDYVKMDTLISLNGTHAYVRGVSGNQIVLCNANELTLDYENAAYLKKIMNLFKDRDKYHLNMLDLNDKITADSNLRLYDAIVTKLKSEKFRGFSNVSLQAEFLEAHRTKFQELNLEEQCIVINEALKLGKCNSELSDLTKLGGSKSAGVLRMNKELPSGTKMIFSSPTGHYKRVVDLDKFL
ncbi:MAG: type II CRISPR RNA-guided endonuclease Cas9, partial [Christensenellales bacterium]